MPAESPPRSLNIFCTSCHGQLGYFSIRSAAITLFKWQVLCETETSVSPTISQCLAATLIATVARSGSSKSLLMQIDSLPSAAQEESPAAGANGAEPTQVLHVWVLNSTIRYASSRRALPVPAIKLLYRVIDITEADSILEKINSDAQEINLPIEAIQSVAQGLKESNGMLPDKDRTFKEWTVGLLERWTG